jgi:hypothetical protein
VRIGGVVAVAVAVAFAVWLVLDRRSSDQSNPTEATSAPAVQVNERPASVVSLADLQKLAASTSLPLYWAGPRAGTRYELTRTGSGAVYVRYLPRGAEAGERDPALTVVTYPVQDALASIENAATSAGSSRIELPGGGLAVVNPARSTNIHFAYPGQDVQVEVYSPQPGVARRLVTSGAVRSLG